MLTPLLSLFRKPVTVVAGALWLATTALAPAEAADVKLLDPGAAQGRQELRQHPPVGLEQSADLVMRMEMTMSMSGMAMPAQALPGMKITMKAKVTGVAPNGDITYTFTTTGAEVVEAGGDPAVRSALEAELKKMIGLGGTVTVTSRGETKDGSFVVPSDSAELQELAANMEKSLSQMSAPLPVEPVGVGAKWVVERSLTENGIAITDSVTYTLAKREGDKATVEVAMTQNAGQQKIADPSLPPEAQPTLVFLKTAGAGSLVLDLGKLFPDSANVAADTQSQMSVEAMGQAMTMDMGVKVESTLTSK